MGETFEAPVKTNIECTAMTFKQSWAWWLMPVTPAHKRLSQED
jgi:hypothetical protein